MRYHLLDCRERVDYATIKSESTHRPDLHLDIADAYAHVREVGGSPHTYFDAALANTINLERAGMMKLDGLMLSLAQSAFFQAICAEFMTNRLNPDGSLNHKALYRMHARLFQAGRMLERTKSAAKVALLETRRSDGRPHKPRPTQAP